MQRRLPKVIYVKLADDGEGGRYLAAEPAAEQLAELRQVVEVGKYQLVERAALSAMPRVLPPAPARRLK